MRNTGAVLVPSTILCAIGDEGGARGRTDLIVPADLTADDLPVTISLLDTAFSKPKRLALGYGFEQATHAWRRPVHTPALPGKTIEASAK